MSGNRLGPYTIVRFISRGGMGEVYEAWDDQLQRVVALKLILPERMDTRGRAYFEREARAGARISHPNLVTTLAHGFEGDRAWIAQEFVPGGWTLKDFIDQLRSEDTLPKGYFGQVAKLIADLADGIEAAHGAGVIHRDIKPQNVLITPEDRPVLADFGLARLVGDAFHSMTGEAGGTWAYMSPEQVVASRVQVDRRTDIFSLGVVLYELLSLRRPFEGDTTQQLALEILYTEPPAPDRIRAQCPQDLSVICAKAMEKQPARRYQSAAELAADLRRHLANQPILAHPPGVWMRASKWMRRNPALASGLWVSAVALVGLSALLWKNVSVNRSLGKANRGLTEQTTVALESATLAEKRAGDVLALSAQRDLEALITQSTELWPPHPDLIEKYEAWLAAADSLREGTLVRFDEGMPARPGLERLREILGRLRQEARPVEAPAELPRVRAHSRYPELVALRSERLWKARMLGLEPWEDWDLVRARVRASELPTDVDELRYRAWDQVSPRTPQYGGEQEAFVIAESAQELAGAEMWNGLWDTIAWARYRTGDLQGAIELATWNVSQPGGEVLAQSLAWLTREVARWSPGERESRLAELTLDDEEIEHLAFEVGELLLQDPAKAWWEQQLRTLVTGIVRLHHPIWGLAGNTKQREFGWGIQKRLEFARKLRDRETVDEAGSQLWRITCAALRSSERYDHLELAPQLGLWPLGADPESGLEEFAHLASGAPPARGPDGKLLFTEDSAIVLVLIPEGTYWMGAQSSDPGGQNYDPHAQSDEGPVHQVSLSPYFLGKHEVDQAQWLRLTNANESFYQVSTFSHNYLHPEEQISWLMSLEVLTRFGLSLPSETQWEYAARAGTSTPWWTGADRETLRGAANIADATAGRAEAKWDGISEWPEFEDGWVAHAEVNALSPNPFGLYGMLGNVWEWCLDGFRDNTYVGHASKDPLEPNDGSIFCMRRGGAYNSGFREIRSAMRWHSPKEMRDRDLGARAARAIDPR